ncbi:S26 family signal peptidase [Actinomadura sp. HBU206391]|uniref:S26 family signal peptidase n=1 Tax=Actinomadura sp. HBU206391 TaxID=2731692 RepID=UPI00164FF3B9|nr:S26 family signal peptidase [Actinomadura sp. HBU206391]MBC6461734.1 S26 family signal peptidase [Actinomadura sp. HBU206391]
MNWWAGALAGIGVSTAVAITMMRRSYLIVTVKGRSMHPTLVEGDRVLVRRGSTRTPRRNDVVILRKPPGPGREASPPHDPPTRGEWSIKRIVATPDDPLPESVAKACGQAPGTPVPAGLFVVLGDAPNSYDSRAWGYLAAENLLGVVVRRLTTSR